MSAEAKFKKIALGSTDEEKLSALFQSNAACPTERALYNKCTDAYNSIDITTRLTTPIRHQINCQAEFLNFRVCLSNHLQQWAEASKLRIEEADKKASA